MEVTHEVKMRNRNGLTEKLESNKLSINYFGSGRHFKMQKKLVQLYLDFSLR